MIPLMIWRVCTIYKLKLHLIFKIVYSETKTIRIKINSSEKSYSNLSPHPFVKHTLRVYSWWNIFVFLSLSSDDLESVHYL
jgi:hypothetical protein